MGFGGVIMCIEGVKIQKVLKKESVSERLRGVIKNLLVRNGELLEKKGPQWPHVPGD